MSSSERLDSSRQNRLSLVWPSSQRLFRKHRANSSREDRLNMVIASYLEQEEAGKAVNQPDLLRVFRNTHMHNQYVQVLLEAGIIGLILFFYLFYQFLRKQITNDSNGRMGWVLVVLFFTGFVGEPFMRNQFTSVLLAFFMGLYYYQSVAKESLAEGNV